MDVRATKLGRAGSALQWFFEPAGEVNQAGRAFLLGQLLGSPLAAIMGSFCAFIVAGVALLRSGGAIYGLFAALEAALMISRLAEWRWRAQRWRHEPGRVPSVDTSVLLSTVWCTLQGALAFTIMSADDLVLSVLSATLVMAMIGPICATITPHRALPSCSFCYAPFHSSEGHWPVASHGWRSLSQLHHPSFWVRCR